MYPHKEALVFRDVRLTHKQFKENCDRLATGLLAAGIQPGDRLGVIAQNCDEFMILYGAASRIGAIVLPINWRFQPDEVEFVLNDCTPKLVFAGPEYRPMAEELSKRLNFVEGWYALGGGDIPASLRTFGSLYSDNGGRPEPDLSSDTGFVIIHTAAVAGRPRGALLSQSNIIHCNLQMVESNGLGPEDCFICLLPLFHIAALSMAMAVMQAGGKNVIVERFDPELVLDLIAEGKGDNPGPFRPDPPDAYG